MPRSTTKTATQHQAPKATRSRTRPVAAAEAVHQAEAPDPVPGEKHRHRWDVHSEVETGRSPSGHSVYSRRDQTCRVCGLHQTDAPWSKTLRS